MRRLLLSAAGLLLGFMACAAHGATYYVAKSGSDAGPGTMAHPWKTIGKAAIVLAPGDTVYIRSGTYNERVVPRRSGAPGRFISYAASPGEVVTIDGRGVNVPQYCGLFDMASKSYISVSGFRVVNSTDQGIVADGSTGIVIAGNYVYNTVTSGIAVWASSNVLIARNEVERACTGIYNECISVGGTDSFEVRGNYVHNVGNPDKEGICAKDGSVNGRIYGNRVHDTQLGIYVDAESRPTYNIRIYANILYDNGSDGIALGSEAGGLLQNIRVYNNISYSNFYNGLQVSAPVLPATPVKKITIINNTFYGNGKQWGCGIYLENGQAGDVEVRNNICSQNLSSQIGMNLSKPPANWKIDHNLIDGPTDICGAFCVKGDPRFVNPADADFDLRSDSPAIDKGSSVDAPPTDIRGVPRPQGAGVDIGAYEYTPHKSAVAPKHGG
ncbi:MAG TPA: right-handed parallel beta-helix repeat-containing protein [Syntrophobacteraceae bacterium]|nr:right-handed parallel beta-helix repeat-containing protein [Syntrophobacteraceae bacterium]